MIGIDEFSSAVAQTLPGVTDEKVIGLLRARPEVWSVQTMMVQGFIAIRFQQALRSNQLKVLKEALKDFASITEHRRSQSDSL